MARKLAHIETVHNIRPIPGADRIEQVNVLGWNVIVKKGEFKEGDLCIYVEIDSKMPADDERFDFLAGKDFKIKTQKMRGVISQGIVFHLGAFPEIKKPKVGDDVTNLLHITKIVTDEERRLAREEGYNKKNAERIKMARVAKKYPNFVKSKFGRWLLGHNFTKNIILAIWGGRAPKPLEFPKWIRKTDEERIQNLPHYCGLPNTFIATEKVDGTSTTFAVAAKNKKFTKFEFIVCSRNVRQATEDQANWHSQDCGNVYWEMAHKYNIENILKVIAKTNKWEKVVLQGETVGLGLQGNRYGYSDRKFFAYNFIVDGRKWDTVKAAKFLADYGITWVPILDTNFKMLPTVPDMLAYAEGYSVIGDTPNKYPREGIVFRAVDFPELSFKAVSNSFLLEKHPDLLARDEAVRKEEEIRGHAMSKEEKKEFYKEHNLKVS
jgi:hypothetical protein